MQLKSLSSTPIEIIHKAFNHAFSDYSIPLQLTLEQFESKLGADNINLALSAGAFEDEQLVGFILHGTNLSGSVKRTYNGGTGVIPIARGEALTQKLYSYIRPILIDFGINQVCLEVIDTNVPAIKSYEKVGFNKVRVLQCYKGEVTLTKQNSDIIIKQIQETDWNSMKLLWDILPSWQNDIQALSKIRSNLVVLGAYINQNLVGFIILNPANNRLHQIAVAKEYQRSGIGSTLLDHYFSDAGKTTSIINVDESSIAVHAFLTAIGLEVFLTQNEMLLTLE